jgi:tetratricopeptide (TPR) repeat protein
MCRHIATILTDKSILADVCPMTTQTKPAVLLRRLSKLERQGRYEDGLSLVSENWQDPSFIPDCYGLEPLEVAGLFLRFGTLLGFGGYIKMVAGSQERSRDLVMRAREMFLDMGEISYAAECENSMALTYSRTGEFSEARIWLDESFGHNLAASDPARLYSQLVRTLIFLSEGRHDENIEYGRSIESLFRRHGDPFLNAGLASNMGISLKDLSRSAEALSYFVLARSFHERSGHKLYLATVENNIALLYKNERQFAMAHTAVDTAISIYRKIRDRSREGSSLETKVQIYLAEGELDSAEKTIERSIEILRRSENLTFLAESITTKSKVLIARDNFADAMLALMEAVDITRQQTGEAAAKRLIAEFEGELNLRRDAISTQAMPTAGDQIEVIIPASLAAYDNYSGVWIHNSFLESIGVHSGSLALVVKCHIKRGDAVALREKESRDVSCGFYDADFGIVCLEGAVDEPQLFNEDDIELLGKIVGFCDESAVRKGGQIAVEVLNL